MFSDESCQLAEILSKLRKEWLPHIQNEKKLNVSCLVSSRKNEEILALNVVESNKHLLELILDDVGVGRENLPIFPKYVMELYTMLQPAVLLTSSQPSMATIETFSVFFLDKTQDPRNHTHFALSQIFHSLHSQLLFAKWCLNHTLPTLNYTPSKILEVCTEYSPLYALKLLGGLHSMNEKEINEIFVEFDNSSTSTNIFRSYSTIVEFVHYLHKCISRTKARSLDETESLLKNIKPDKLRLKTMEDLFCLCFMRREDIVFPDSTSESCESEEVLLWVKLPSSYKCSSEPCTSNSTSPSSQAGTSSATRVEKSTVSLDFLCQQSGKLQLSLEMLQRQIQHLDEVGDEELQLRLTKLQRHINDSLWRLRLLETSDRYLQHNFSRGNGHVSVRKAWIASVPSTIQTCFHHIPARRKLRVKTPTKKFMTNDPRLVNRLLAEPQSLMATIMVNGSLSVAQQVADHHQLWASIEGRELRFTLNHVKASHELRQAQQQLEQRPAFQKSSTNTFDSRIGQSLISVALGSVMETLLLTLWQMRPLLNGVSSDQLMAILFADLVTFTASLLSTAESWSVYDVAWQRFQVMSVDVTIEPWKSFAKLVRAVFCRHGQYPLRSPLPLEVNVISRLCRNLEQLVMAFRKLQSLLENDEMMDEVPMKLSQLSNSLSEIATSTSNKHVMGICNYVQILFQLSSSGASHCSATHLLSQDIGVLVLCHLQKDLTAIERTEGATALLGIRLPCFIARCLRPTPNQTLPMDFFPFLADTSFIEALLRYLRKQCPLLEQVTSLQLSIEYGVEMTPSATPVNADLDLWQRFLEYRRKRPRFLVVAHKTKVAPLISPQTTSLKIRSPKSSADSENRLTTENKMVCLDWSLMLLDVVPSVLIAQLKHLVTQPLAMLEQVLMNGQIAAAADLIKVIQRHSTTELASLDSRINEMLLCYASKALALNLTEAPLFAGKMNRIQQQEQHSKKKKMAFTMPASVPPRDQWVADALVSQCPCCQKVQFSMFNRRHHCRRCGRVVCADCSPHRHLVDGYGDVPMRMCNDCLATMHSTGTPSRTAHHDGRILWSLSLDAQHNEIVRREFSYEYAPNLALALAIVQLCREKDDVPQFLLNQSSAMLFSLHRHLLTGALLEVDPTMVLQLIKSLVLTAKMRFSEIRVVKPTRERPSRGLARCDALLSQIDLLSLLASANCLHLLPAKASLGQLDTWRKLRDRLIEIELWSLSLDISTKAGLDAASVWAAWGLVCLKAGNFQGARQRFQRCLKPVTKPSPLLQEIVSVLENLSLPALSSDNGSSNSSGSISSDAGDGGIASGTGTGTETGMGSCIDSVTANSTSWKQRKITPMHEKITVPDQPQLVMVSLARLRSICTGNLVIGVQDSVLDEILFYLATYGSEESPYVYMVERGHIEGATQRFFNQIDSMPVSVFNLGLLLPCLRAGRLADLLLELKRHDDSLQVWKPYLLGAAQLLETKSYWNCLYQLHCLSGDHLRAGLTAMHHLYLGDLFTIESFLARAGLLKEILIHLQCYLSNPPVEPKEERPDDYWPLWWPASEATSLECTVHLQLQLTEFIDPFFREGRLTSALLAVMKSVTQSYQDHSSTTSVDYQIPSLLGSRSDCCASAVLVTVISPSSSGFELSWKICSEQHIRLDRYFRMSAFILIKQFQVPALIRLVDFVKQRMTPTSIGFFDVEELLVECASLVQDRDKEHKSKDTESIVQQIKKPIIKVQTYINLGWLKSAYILAVQNKLMSEVINIQQEADRLQQTAVLTLCNRWLASRNAPK